MQAPKFFQGSNSAAALLLSLNFILLSFFIVLVGLSPTHTTVKKDLVVAGLGFSRPHDEVTPQPPGLFLPHAGNSGWQVKLAPQVLGLVSNQLGVTTAESETDADKLIVKLPLRVLFKDGALTEVARTSIPNLVQLGTSAQVAVEVWLQEDAPREVLRKQLQELGKVADKALVGWRSGASEVQIIYRPLPDLNSLVPEENLGRLPEAVHDTGGDLHGQGE